MRGESSTMIFHRAVLPSSLSHETFSVVHTLIVCTLQENKAVYFTASGKAREQSMTLYFVCSSCTKSWSDV